ncbi:MAG: dihydroneopterin aldolase [Bacteroidales bacterium]|nr:dihydroneopterin aldolase [Candidatus Physcousia equi]
MTTTISLNGMRFYAYHGVFDDERKQGAWYVVHVHARVDCPKAMQSDNLEETLNYAAMAAVVSREMATPSQLIEHVGARIFEKLYQAFPVIRNLVVEIHKEHPPIPIECASSSFRIEG